MSSELKARLQADLIRARKARERERTLVLGTTLAELRNREIEKRGDADDGDVLAVIGRAVKQRREAAEQMRAGGREDLAEKEEIEALVLGAYLPEPLSEDEVRVLVRDVIAAGASDMGAVMGALMPRVQGRFEGRQASRIAREELGA